MVTLRIGLNEEFYQKLEAVAGEQHRAPEQTASLLLIAAITSLPAMGRYVAVHGATLDTLEAILQGGSILSGPDLLQKVQNLAGITYGNIRLDFTPNQLQHIADRAERLSLSPEELVRRAVRAMEEGFFGHLGMDR